MEIKVVAIELKNGDLYVTQEGLPVSAILIPLPALANRRVLYGLDNNEQAIESILREHAQRICNLPPCDEGPSEKAKQCGGLRSDVTIDGESAVIDEATRQAIWR